MYNRYHPKLGPVAQSFEYEIGDCAPDLQTVQHTVHLIELEGKQHLEVVTTVRLNGTIKEDQMFNDIVPVNSKTSIISQAHALLADVTSTHLSKAQYLARK